MEEENFDEGKQSYLDYNAPEKERDFQDEDLYKERDEREKAKTEREKGDMTPEGKESYLDRQMGGSGLTQDISDAELNSIQLGKASPLDVDFLLILIIALMADLAVDPFLETIGAILSAGVTLVISRIIDVIITFVIGGWFYWKSKQISLPKELAEKVKGMEKKVAAKIQAKIQKKVASKAMRRVLIRVGAALAVELTPAIAVFTSWVALVLSVL